MRALSCLISWPSTFGLRLGSTLVLGGTVSLGGAVLPACTLITDVDRQRIQVDDPPFPEDPEDGGTLDAAVIVHPPIIDSGGGGPDAAADAGVTADAGDAGDLEPDASGDGG